MSQVASVEGRAASGYDGVIISGSSTMPALADETAYPRLLRVIPNDLARSRGIAAVCRELGWSHVAVVHETSDWGLALVSELEVQLEAVGSDIIVKLVVNATEAFTLVDSLQVLTALQEAHTRVVILAVKPDVQRSLFAAAYDNSVRACALTAHRNSW